MMKNRFAVAGLFLLIIVLGIASACGGGEEETAPTGSSTTTAGQTTASTTQTTTSATTATTTSTQAADELTELFGKWTGSDPVHFDLTVSITGQASMTGHIWQTNTKQRVEYSMEGQTIIMIFDTDENVMYTYMPDQNMAMKATLDPSQMSQGTWEGDMAEVLGHEPAIVGTEYFDGKECKVVTFSTGEMSVKLWVWIDTGFPIKTEGTTSEGMLTVMEYTNIDFSDIPDSVFQIPEGVQITEI